MDLTQDYPRSPREKLDGIMLLPRAIDKARAQLEDRLGDYIYFGCSLNEQLFQTIGTNPEDFLHAVRRLKTDDDIVAWIRSELRPDSGRIEAMNQQLFEPPKSQSERDSLRDAADEIDPGNESVKTWIDLIDLEEGRLPKESATAT